MNLNTEELSQLETWLEDESFIHWAKEEHAEDVAKWEQYFDRRPQIRELGNLGRRLVIGIPFQEISRDEHRRTAKLHHLMRSLEEKTAHPVLPARESRVVALRRHWQAVASIALLIAVSGWLYFQLFDNLEVLLSTAFGQTLTTTLPDGSVVTLNANSTLSYQKKTPRLVRLTGEAFFDIKEKPQTQENFQVFTEDLTITVLGTTFNVNSRNEQTKVFLEEGKVKLQLEDRPTEPLEMAPGDLVSYSKKQQKILENRQDDVLENTSWKEGALFFDKTPLFKVLSKIEDIYGVQFIITDSVPEERVLSGGVPIRNLKITLETLQDAFGIKITLEKDKYLIVQ